jgi:cytochrome P450 family 135
LSRAKPRPPASRAPAWLQAWRYTRDPLAFIVGGARRWGDVFTIRFPYFGRIYYVASPAVAKEVFAGDPAVFHAGEANATVLEPTLGPRSVLNLDDAPHMRARKVLLPPFHGDRISTYGELMVTATRREMESWPVGEPFALLPHTQKITLTVILRAVFGITEQARIERATVLLNRLMSTSSVITKFPVLRRDLGPGSPWRRFATARAKFDEMIHEEIALRRASIEAGEERDDVLSLLLAARHDDGSAMSDAELRDELVTVVGAGHETTATALAWAIERLLRNPAVLARLRESLAAGETDYLEATVRETLRSRPVLIDVARKLAAPARVGGYEFPRGAFLVPAIAAIHHRADLYPEPFEFRPERWLAEGATSESYSWLPFGGGIRRCVGAAFAEYEMRTILAEIVTTADLKAAEPAAERGKVHHITLAPEHGARVVLARRPGPGQALDAVAASASSALA